METIQNAFVDAYPFTTDQIAHELKMEVPTFRVWKNKLETTGVLTRPKLGGHLCIQDPHSKNRILYSEEYVERLKEIRERMPRRIKKEQAYRDGSMKNALMKVTIPIFDPNIMNFIKKKFNGEIGLETYLRDHINSIAFPVLNKIEELKKKHAKELEEALKEF